MQRSAFIPGQAQEIRTFGSCCSSLFVNWKKAISRHREQFPLHLSRACCTVRCTHHNAYQRNAKFSVPLVVLWSGWPGLFGVCVRNLGEYFRKRKRTCRKSQILTVLSPALVASIVPCGWKATPDTQSRCPSPLMRRSQFGTDQTFHVSSSLTVAIIACGTWVESVISVCCIYIHRKKKLRKLVIHNVLFRTHF